MMISCAMHVLLPYECTVHVHLSRPRILLCILLQVQLWLLTAGGGRGGGEGNDYNIAYI